MFVRYPELPEASWLIQRLSRESPGARSRSVATTGSATPYVPEAAVLYVRARMRSGWSDEIDRAPAPPETPKVTPATSE